MTNPVMNGLPVNRLPIELFAPSKANLETLPLSCLSQRPPDVYTLATGDVLGIWIEGIFANPEAQTPPPAQLYVPEKLQLNLANQAPGLGYPVPVERDGTIVLPVVGPIPAAGKSLADVREAVRRAFTVEKRILKEGQEGVIVTLIRPRTERITVIRQEHGQAPGSVLDLPAHESDVLTALARTGGLPLDESFDGVMIMRAGCKRDTLVQQLRSPAWHVTAPCADGSVLWIPMRIKKGEPLPFSPEDVVLHSGDVVLVKNRAREVFYTAGLLPAGEHTLPRDYDLDAVTAIARIRGTMVNGGFLINNTSYPPAPTTLPGMGSPSPNLLIVLRRTPSGGRVPIRVDMNKALVDPRESLLVQAEDILVLQEQPGQALVRYFNDTFANFNFVWHPLNSKHFGFAADLASPSRIPARMFYQYQTLQSPQQVLPQP